MTANGKKIDTTLVSTGDGRLEARANDLDVSIAGTAGDSDLVQVELDEGTSLSWALTGAGVDKVVPVTGKGKAARGKTNKSGVVFDGVAPGLGMSLEATPAGVKEDLVLADANAPTKYDFALDVDGLSVVEAGGGLHFVNDKKQVVAAVPAGFMEDAKGVMSEGVTMKLTGPKDSPVLRVEVDQKWLADPAREFPVRVDPTIQLDTGVDDTHVEDTRPTTNFGGYSFMRMGLSGGTKSRAFVQFDMSALNGKTIDYAKLVLWNRTSASCTPYVVNVHRVTQDWTGSSVNWPGPSYAEKVGTVTDSKGGPTCAAGPLSIWMSQAVRDWTSGATENHGVTVRTTETTSNASKTFNSSEAGSDQPYLLVSWRESLLGNLGYYTLNSQTLTDRTQAHVNVANRNLMIQAADVQLPGVADMGLDIARYYNSREDAINPVRAGMTGTGWTTNVGRDIRFSVNGYDESGYFQGPSGFRITFPYNRSTGKYEKPAGLNASVTRNSTTTFDYTVEMHDTGMKYRFVGNGAPLASIEDQNGNKITMNYGSGEQLNSITDTHGENTTFAYNSDGFITSITDPDNRKVTYTYNGRDLASATDQAGEKTSYGYDSNHNMTSLTDPRGGITRFAYNSDDQLATITSADSTTAKPVVTTYAASFGTGTDMTDPNGNKWVYKFDDKGRLETFSSPRSGVSEDYAYDAFNSVTNYTTNNGGIGTLSYDGYNVKSVQSDNGAKSTFDYANSGPGQENENRPSRYTNAQGNALNYTWGNDQQMTSVKNGSGALKAQMTYRSSSQSCTGALATAKDGKNNTTTYSYDSQCNMTKVDRPAPEGDTTMTYDAYNRVRTITDGRGITQTVTYDAKDRVTQVSWPSTSQGVNRVSYTYDKNGNRTTRSDVQGGATKTSTYTLDARNRVKIEALPGVTNSYAYDQAGNMASQTTPWGTTTYTYDRENDVKTITPPSGGTINFDYYEHTYAAVKYPNGVTDAQHYDTDGRIQQIDQYSYNGTGTYRQLADLDYKYKNPATNKNTDSVYEIKDVDYDSSLKYTYDTESRIKTSKGVSAGDIFEENSYTYDANSNRTAWEYGSRGIVNQYTASYNTADQMTSMTGPTGTTNFTYDQIGNMTADSAGSAMSYDARNRATSVKHRYSNRGNETATYDGTSQFERTKIGGTTFANSVLGVMSSTDSTGTRNYVRAPDGRVLAERRPNGDWRYYLTDHLGSIIGGTDQTGSRTESYGYGAYGEYQYGSGGNTNLIYWRYTGAWLDGNSVTGNGFYKIGLRYYDDQIGRWNQTDPLERVINPSQPSEAQPYNYAGCNPTNQTDPTGAASDGFVCGLALTALGVSLVAGVLFPPVALGAIALASIGLTLEAAATIISCEEYF